VPACRQSVGFGWARCRKMDYKGQKRETGEEYPFEGGEVLDSKEGTRITILKKRASYFASSWYSKKKGERNVHQIIKRGKESGVSATVHATEDTDKKKGKEKRFRLNTIGMAESQKPLGKVSCPRKEKEDKGRPTKRKAQLVERMGRRSKKGVIMQPNKKSIFIERNHSHLSKWRWGLL